MEPDLTASNVLAPIPGVVMRRTKTGIAVMRLHYTADPDKRSAEWREAERAKYTTPAWWKQEMEIEYEARSGQRVYPEFNPAIHVIADDRIPKQLTRYCSIDPHPRTPHAILWLGIDRWSDWYVYRELWPSVVWGEARTIGDDEPDNHFTTRDYCETITWLEGNSLKFKDEGHDSEYATYRREPNGEEIVYRFMDYAGKGFRASSEDEAEESYATRYERYGLSVQKPYKSLKAGEDAIRALLKPRMHETRGEWPRLHIAEGCRETILELQKLRYQITKRLTTERELKQDPVEARSHMVDNLRYLATSNISYIRNCVSSQAA